MAVSSASPANVFDAACPSRRALELISGKWVALVALDRWAETHHAQMDAAARRHDAAAARRA